MRMLSLVGTTIKCIIYFNGQKEWYKDNKLHRINGPALENKKGEKFWFRNGKVYGVNVKVP